MWQGCFSAYSSKKVNHRSPFGFFGVVKNATGPKVAPYSTRITTHGSAVHWMTGCSICLGRGSGKNGIPTLRRALRSEEHTSELQSRGHLVCRLLLEKQNEAMSAPHSSV